MADNETDSTIDNVLSLVLQVLGLVWLCSPISFIVTNTQFTSIYSDFTQSSFSYLYFFECIKLTRPLDGAEVLTTLIGWKKG